MGDLKVESQETIENNGGPSELDLRRIELVNKKGSGDITPKEDAELIGLRVFPDDPRGAELKKKEVLGSITQEEKAELVRLNQLDTRRKNYSPEVIGLWERVEANDPNVVKVDMDSGSSVEVQPADEQEKIIWTSALGGCYGVVVFTEHQNGKRTTLLTHYSPDNISGNMKKLEELFSAHNDIKNAKIKKAIIMAPGEWQQDPNTSKWQIRAKTTDEIIPLTAAIEASLGESIDVKIEPYSEKIESGKKDQGVLVVKVPPSSKGPTVYKVELGSDMLLN